MGYGPSLETYSVWNITIVPEYVRHLAQKTGFTRAELRASPTEKHTDQPTVTHHQPLNVDTVLIFYTSPSHLDVMHILHSSISSRVSQGYQLGKLPLPVELLIWDEKARMDMKAFEHLVFVE